MLRRESFRIEGFDCAEEVRILTAQFARVPGIVDLEFDIIRARMTVTFDDAAVSTAEIVEAVAGTGMRAVPWNALGAPAGGGLWSEHRRLILAGLSGVLLLAGFLMHAWSFGGFAAAFGFGTPRETRLPWGAYVAYAASIAAGIWLVAPRAWGALRRAQPDMHLLMCVAVAGAVLLGEWFEAASVTFLFAVALQLEQWSMGRTRRAIAALLDLSPPTARVRNVQTGAESELPVADVAVGDVVIVRPHERIGLDGRVCRGESAVNEAPITGESLPVTKRPDDEVFAGTINEDGVFEFRVTRPASDTTLAHIVQMIEAAHARRAPSEQWVQTFARYYTPAMMLLAGLLAFLPPLLLPGWRGEWVESIYRGLVVLVIACPCALVISTPVSVVSAITSAARHGVLVKGGLHLENCAHLRALALDKTGTLTSGRPEVQRVIPLNGHSEEELLARAAALEARSSHPIARAILRFAHERGVPALPAEGYQVLTGRGAEGEFDGRRFWIGSQRLLRETGADSPEIRELASQLEDAGHTIVAVGNSGHVCGLIGVADAVRERADEALAGLRRAGIERIVMLTGDNERTASAVAEVVGVDAYRSDLLPAEKVREVEALQREFGRVAMLGDGVNDAPAMAAADVGMAMAAMGTDAAIETADVALMSDDLSKIAWLIAHARSTLAVVRQNIAFALGTKAAFLALNLIGAASLWTAIAADMGASLVVIFNGLRLLRN